MHPAFTTSARFPHRTNPDGTIDSICPHCYVTIGTAEWDSDLAAMEAAHLCDPALLKHYQEQSGTTKKPPEHQKPPITPVYQRRTGK